MRAIIAKLTLAAVSLMITSESLAQSMDLKSVIRDGVQREHEISQEIRKAIKAQESQEDVVFVKSEVVEELKSVELVNLDKIEIKKHKNKTLPAVKKQSGKSRNVAAL